MEVRKWWMSTYGKGTTAISSEGISTIGSEFAPYLSNGEYASAFDTYARLCDDYISKAPNLAQEYAQALGSLTSLQDGLRFVNDDAHLLTKDERKELNDTLTEIGKRQGLDVALLTTKDTGGKAILDYAMTMYEALNYGQGKNRDGVLLVVNMETRKFWMATHGYGITAFTDAGISYISEKLGPSLKKEKLYEGYLQLMRVFAISLLRRHIVVSLMMLGICHLNASMVLCTNFSFSRLCVCSLCGWFKA
mgnify:CR=1 FL=1